MIVVCGEALMDVFCERDTCSGMQLQACIGGSPLNVAIGLARLAHPVAFVGTLSRDALGERILRALLAEGVDASRLQRSDAPTALGLVGLDAHGVPAYTFHGEHSAERQLDLGALGELPETARALHVGSYTLVVPPVAGALRRLLEREASRRVIAWDPNLRPGVEPDLARWREVLDWMLPHCHLLKISDEDLALLLPGVAPQDFASRALDRGVSLVVVTRGARGALAWSRQAHARADAVPARLVDTVGAGDSFQAAMLAWLGRRGRLSREALGMLDAQELLQLLRTAAQAAALTCSRRGAALPRHHELPGLDGVV